MKNAALCSVVMEFAYYLKILKLWNMESIFWVYPLLSQYQFYYSDIYQNVLRKEETSYKVLLSKMLIMTDSILHNLVPTALNLWSVMEDHKLMRRKNLGNKARIYLIEWLKGGKVKQKPN